VEVDFGICVVVDFGICVVVGSPLFNASEYESSTGVINPSLYLINEYAKNIMIIKKHTTTLNIILYRYNEIKIIHDICINNLT
jgi:hypothetical protein